MECDCDVDQPLIEIALGGVGFDPMLFEGFVGEKELTFADESQPFFEMRRARHLLSTRHRRKHLHGIPVVEPGIEVLHLRTVNSDQLPKLRVDLQ